MAKMTKGMLKGLVKECLVELLTEGLGAGASQLVEAQSAPRRSRPTNKRKSIFDQIDQSFATAKPKTGFNEAVAAAARTATSDPILQQLLADTAKTTLQEQLQHEPRGAHVAPGMMAPVQDSSPIAQAPGAGLDINSLFGEATNNWGEVLDRADAKKLP